MGKKLVILLVLGTFLSGMSIAGCSSSDNGTSPTATVPHSILGTWTYRLIMGGNTWDNGSITFSGSDTSGTYRKTNFYNVVYTGNYSVNGVTISITETNQEWRGSFSNANSMGGSWTAGSDQGSWTATRQ